VIVLACLEPPKPGRAAKAADRLARKLGISAETVAVSAGGPRESESLAWAIDRRSFQRIIHLDDPALDKADFMTVATVLSEVARQIRADVIIAGEHSDGEGQGLVPAALAHQLQASFIARVLDARIADSGRLEATVPAAGRLCTVDCPVPVVISTSVTLDDDRAPDARNPASCAEPLSLAQLTLDPSRLVPRPELLGSLVPFPAELRRQMTPEQAARFILQQS
jgi:electron transfer flavoprotein alpha/beta subunit